MLKLEELETYQLAMEVADEIWFEVVTWSNFANDTVGKQIVRASDSVAANISEGYGRYSFKENKQFCYYSRGSLYETKTFLVKAKNRKLISEEKFQQLFSKLELLSKKLNAYIKSIGIKANKEIN
jgi:four helix bundle protein